MILRQKDDEIGLDIVFNQLDPETKDGYKNGDSRDLPYYLQD